MNRGDCRLEWFDIMVNRAKEAGLSSMHLVEYDEESYMTYQVEKDNFYEVEYHSYRHNLRVTKSRL